jgi:hypothetical protein
MLKKIGSGLAAVGAALPSLLLDLVGLAGAAAIGYGAWMIYAPAGFITGGCLLLAGTLLVARR